MENLYQFFTISVVKFFTLPAGPCLSALELILHTVQYKLGGYSDDR